MITYKEYLADSARLHDNYWAQFVRPGLVAYVKTSFSQDILACPDRYFNNIALNTKDAIAHRLRLGGYMNMELYNQAADARRLIGGRAVRPSLSELVCVVCAAMRLARQELITEQGLNNEDA